MSEQTEAPKTKKPRAPINALKIINQFRLERGLPKARKPSPPKPARPPKPPKALKVTRQMVAQICADGWKEQYPASLTAEIYEGGSLTTKLVESEVERRIAILKGDLIPIGGRRAK